MTKLSVQNLYQTDFALWVENTISKLKSQDYIHVDWENLIEEIEALGGRDRRELESRLTTLFEHLLKRRYVNLPECYRGWDVTISRTQQELKRIFRDSPSLRNYYLTVVDECYQDAVKNMNKEYDHQFPEDCPFPTDIDGLLTIN
ncbi:MAG: DUF29 domain-containing protein [Sphaerospermopsis sp.]|uniref:DUF29 domain-containing protein n=1 Tax=Sphaerospermopsis sp. LEGE 00249 TaxID=1380707 RepID=UPI00164E2862|nr:DUF29 domain-containing protein [Sphaerospermopsis sp. LEGE 00249]MBC5796728.1 DUF29 domain-containing protein [Sphaerospermopsis sp. LEGE 00249]MEB3149738.1 DUF29 domain-containing protein [Sphaerospermopsis sp.]